MQGLLAAVLALALLLAGCDNDDEATNRTRSASTTQPARTTHPSDAPLPGERVEIFPYKGAQLAVVGVASDDTLKVRSGPGIGFDVLFDLHPLAMNATATGHNRSLANSGFWSEIIVDGQTGCANTAFLLQPGQVTDITAALFPNPAARLRADTTRKLGHAVAGLRASDNPASDIVMVHETTVGDLAHITVDVIGLGDDAQGGERLKIFAEPNPSGEHFTVRAVEATALCSRGVSDDGLCL